MALWLDVYIINTRSENFFRLMANTLRKFHIWIKYATFFHIRANYANVFHIRLNVPKFLTLWQNSANVFHLRAKYANAFHIRTMCSKSFPFNTTCKVLGIMTRHASQILLRQIMQMFFTLRLNILRFSTLGQIMPQCLTYYISSSI